MQTAPADSTCSHSGILTCGRARDTTATTSGARPAGSRSRRQPAVVGIRLIGPERRRDDLADAPRAPRPR